MRANLGNDPIRTFTASIAEQISGQIGPAVLLPILKGEKRPQIEGWHRLTFADMTPEHLAQLNHGNNIGVLLGEPSQWLCTVDADNDDLLETFLAENPRLRESLISKGARGGNVWVRIKGEYPPAGKIKTRDGEPWGEWRADGNQTVIYGRHPSGADYSNNGKRPISIEFSQIAWPDKLELPWQKPQPEAHIYDVLVKRYGYPFSGKGCIQINQMFFVARFAVEHLVLHEPNERDFYTYEPACGAWMPRTPDAIKAMFAEDWQRYVNEVGEPALIPLRTNGLLDNLTSLLRGHVEKPAAFARTDRVIHLANGMLQLDDEGAELREFSPDYHSRNVCPISWEAEAECPRFKSELLATTLEPEDINLLQRWCGSLLLGRNLAQKIMLLTGTPGGGKSTLLEIIETIIGRANVCQLRTEHLSERFELSRFLRKTMLSGKDVKGDFLQTEGAHVLKALVGHDLLSAERKNSNSEFQLRGEFGVAISCNSHLRVRLDGDVEAWRRRLLIVRYEKPKPAERVLDFAKTLLAAEASGILRWMVDGAIMHLRECDAISDYRLTGAQASRIDQLQAESDSIRHFVIERIQSSKARDLTTAEIVSAYLDYCSEKGWVAFSSKTVERNLPDLMLELFRSALSTHVERNGKRQKGYPNVSLVLADYE